jgi:hypothetical protein
MNGAEICIFYPEIPGPVPFYNYDCNVLEGSQGPFGFKNSDSLSCLVPQRFIFPCFWSANPLNLHAIKVFRMLCRRLYRRSFKKTHAGNIHHSFRCHPCSAQPRQTSRRRAPSVSPQTPEGRQTVAHHGSGGKAFRQQEKSPARGDTYSQPHNAPSPSKAPFDVQVRALLVWVLMQGHVNVRIVLWGRGE